MTSVTSQSGPPICALPALVADGCAALILTSDGEIETLESTALRRRLQDMPHLVCHRAFTARRLGLTHNRRQDNLFNLHTADIMELFAFVLPVHFCLPTPRSLAQALGIDEPDSAIQEALVLHRATGILMGYLASGNYAYGDRAFASACLLRDHGWPWGEAVVEALMSQQKGVGAEISVSGSALDALSVWRDLAEWRDVSPYDQLQDDTPPTSQSIEQRLAVLKGVDAEARTPQDDYAQAAGLAFAAFEEPNRPHVALVEAGTGTGKTLGYIAPASLWAEQNAGPVWISTYTRNLQHQLQRELTRLNDLPGWRGKSGVVIRKGRENYLCLLNMQAIMQRASAGLDTVAATLVARWARYSRSGDMSDDFPTWLLANNGHSLRREMLADRRGDCIYDACPHYRKCFIERVVRDSRQARIVVANHALVLRWAASQTLLDDTTDDISSGASDATRYIFDEGHHLFDTADGAFSTDLTISEAAELRRWLLGTQGDRVRGARHQDGLAARLENNMADDATLAELVAKVQEAALVLPASGWGQRLESNRPHEIAERFFTLVRRQVHDRADGERNPYSLEASVWPPDKALVGAAQDMAQALVRLAESLEAVVATLREGDEVEPQHRLRRFVLWLEEIKRWRMMLSDLVSPDAENIDDGKQEVFVDWLSVDKREGREYDTGLHRHYLDPTEPFARYVLHSSHGALITSATLHDPFLDDEHEVDNWRQATFRTGARHLPEPAKRFRFASPFDYAVQTRVFVVSDMGRSDDMECVAEAYRALFLASGGGALGLFTAISRLRSVHERIAPTLHEAGLALFAQHVDALDAGTLVDLFQNEHNSCLLGTDAFRDGIDVSGASLRLMVMERTPWPRPNILHRARRAHFGGRLYDDGLARLRLRQAFGRLIRKRSDRGVFVLLDNRAPGRILSALPEDVIPERLPLDEIVGATETFLGR
ncbi:MAG: ATP-dependent DNA helicase [Parvularculales bacterium]